MNRFLALSTATILCLGSNADPNLLDAISMAEPGAPATNATDTATVTPDAAATNEVEVVDELPVPDGTNAVAAVEDEPDPTPTASAVAAFNQALAANATNEVPEKAEVPASAEEAPAIEEAPATEPAEAGIPASSGVPAPATETPAAPETDSTAVPEPPETPSAPAPATAQDTAVPEARKLATPDKELREEGTDEIDLEDVDDSAEAAKKPTIKSDSDNIEFVDISCDEATIADILRQFRKTTRANIISDDSTNLLRRVSAELRHVPWLEALKSILNSRGFRLEQRGSIYFVNEDAVTEPTFTRPFVLNHASADDLTKLFNETYGQKDKAGKVVARIANSFPQANVVVVTAKEKVLADCENIIKAIDKAVAQIYIEARFLELSSNASHALGLNWSSLKDWGITASGIKAGFLHNEAEAANYGSGVTTHTLNKNQNSTLTESKSSNASASSDGTTSSSSSASPSSSKNDTSSESTTYNGLFPKEIGSAVNEAISAADMAWRNAYGYSGQLSAKEFSIAISAFESLGEGKVFSNPKIIVANGKEARVDMTTKEPNVSVEASYTGTSSQNMNISTKIEVIPGKDDLMFAGEAFFSYGISLSVKPRISPDGLINVEIVPTISQLDTSKGDNGYKVIKGATEQSVYTKYPIIDVKRLTTNFTMQDGATAVIGGLTRTNERDVDDGIPYLRKIPWIGQKLFGHKSRIKEQSEIIVFVTIGIANPHALPKDIGLPTNAVIGREYVEGKRFEPGHRGGSAAEVLRLDTRDLEEIQRNPPKPREAEPARGSVSVVPSEKQ